MQASDVKKCVWIGVEDWSKLTVSVLTIDDGLYVGYMDIDAFVENIFQEIAEQLNIPYEELKPVLVEKNAEFYEEKERLFEMYDGIEKSHVLLYNLKNMLRIPDISFIPAELRMTKIERIVHDFESLSNDDKKKVMQQLGLIPALIKS